MIEKLEEYIIKNKLIDVNDKIVIGVSGGPDSLCLLYLLNELKEKYNLTLIVAHINHMIRQEADFEENFVKETSNKLGLTFYSKKVDVLKEASEYKKSTEEYARKVRYDFFEEIFNKENANKIVVAHNQNDNVETILMNIVRGTGLDGLLGIEVKTKNIIRPLLCVTRDEIEQYCKEKNLTPMIDKTNFETIYTRNKMRNIIIPNLKEINPNILNVVTRMSTILKDEDNVIDSIAKEKYDLVVSRAVANIETLLKYTMHLLNKDGKLIAMKGDIDKELTKDVEKNIQKKYNIIKIDKFYLKDDIKRSLIMIKNK